MESPGLVTVIVAAESEAYPASRRTADPETARAVFPTRHLRRSSRIGSPEKVARTLRPGSPERQDVRGDTDVARFSRPSRTVTAATRVQPSAPDESSLSAHQRPTLSADLLRPANPGR